MKRDIRNAVLGGVCAGIAKSLGMPTLLVRLAFIIGLCWLGAPLLIYLLLWILMPADDYSTEFLDNFVLERDEANGMIAGVCAGLAESIGMDVTIMRLLWVCSVFYFGFGVVPYLILWILMPKKST
jgi:phage shock protein PspC (stress-responsive transcriptional regulator)